jgi:perosamine synthetase
VSELALFGGSPVRSTPWTSISTVGDEEKKAVLEVLDSGVLSDFVAAWGNHFQGGERVKRLEGYVRKRFGVAHAVAVNSATSGLNAAVGAAGVGPGDEVIVSPYTMSASATCVLVYQAIPVFADIDPETYCLDPESIRRNITPLTRAIVVVDLFGHPAPMDKIMEIAREHNLVVIEDSAQAPGATLDGRPAGTLGHIGVYSFNYHKVVHSGEGGMVVTDDPRLAERLQLIRNHAEVVVGDMGVEDITNMVGFNYRMTEIEAAIAFEQLQRLDTLIATRRRLAGRLSRGLEGLPGIGTPVVPANVEHGWYLYPLRFRADVVGISRERFIEALHAEGLPAAPGYIKPIYLEPMYQQRIAFGRDGWPFTGGEYTGNVSYDKGICPVAELMYEQEIVNIHALANGPAEDDIDGLIAGIRKVLANVDELKG